MHQARLVGRMQSPPRGEQSRERLAFVDIATREPRMQVLPIDALHRDEEAPLVLVDLVHRDDVGMAEARQRLRLTNERRPGLVVGIPKDRLLEHLDRDLAFQRRIDRPVHRAHPAAAEQADHAVLADHRGRLGKRVVGHEPERALENGVHTAVARRFHPTRW